MRAQTLLTTTTTLIAVPTNLTVGQTLTLTATVTASGGATPAGTVTFNDGATALGTATLNNSGVVALAIAAAVGSYSIAAAYSGSATDASSQSAPPVVVNYLAGPQYVIGSFGKLQPYAQFLVGWAGSNTHFRLEAEAILHSRLARAPTTASAAGGPSEGNTSTRCGLVRPTLSMSRRINSCPTDSRVVLPSGWCGS